MSRTPLTRTCDRCPNVRVVRTLRAALNLCRDCREALTPAQRAAWRRNPAELRAVKAATPDQMTRWAA